MMPLADMFAPDINFVSQRGVYPTASGGSVASASGALNQNTAVQVSDAASGNSGVAVMSGAPVTTSGHSVVWWIGFVVFLLVMVFVARKAGGEEDFRNIRPTFYNFMTITLTAVVGIVGLKVIAAKYRIPGASDLILAA
jgi:hypothetical protein